MTQDVRISSRKTLIYVPTFLATFLTSRWILLVSSLIEYRLTFLMIQCYPELQGKTFWTLDVLLLSNTHSFLNWLSTLTCIGVTSPAIRLPHWRCLQSLSTHLREDILIIFLPRFSSTNQFLLFDASNSSWTLLKLLPSKFGCATLIPHPTLVIDVHPSRWVKLCILLTTWLPIPCIILTNSHGRLIMYSYMPSLNIRQCIFIFSHAMLCLIILVFARWFLS